LPGGACSVILAGSPVGSSPRAARNPVGAAAAIRTCRDPTARRATGQIQCAYSVGCSSARTQAGRAGCAARSTAIPGHSGTAGPAAVSTYSTTTGARTAGASTAATATSAAGATATAGAAAVASAIATAIPATVSTAWREQPVAGSRKCDPSPKDDPYKPPGSAVVATTTTAIRCAKAKLLGDFKALFGRPMAAMTTPPSAVHSSA
jgi:hypothetical protein